MSTDADLTLPAPEADPPLEEWASCSLCGVRSPLKTRIIPFPPELRTEAWGALAFAYARLGQDAASQAALATARAADPGSHLLALIERRLPALPSSSSPLQRTVDAARPESLQCVP
jgi:hypothetical protein